MGKFLFWLVVFFVVLFALRMISVANSRRKRNQRAPERPPAAGAMIRCVDCGVYLPSVDAKPSARGPLCGDPQCVRRHDKAEP